MIRACIPGYRTVDSAERPSGTGRLHYVYTVHVTHRGRLHRVYQRYSAFHRLHHQFRKLYPISCPFPPKRLRNTSHKVLEGRRQGLEAWLGEVLTLHPPPPPLLAFLGLSAADLDEHSPLPPPAPAHTYASSLISFTREPPFSCPLLEASVVAALYDDGLCLPL